MRLMISLDIGENMFERDISLDDVIKLLKIVTVYRPAEDRWIEGRVRIGK